MSALGSLVVKLALEHAEFTKGLDKSSQEALRFAKNSQDSFDKFSRSTTTAFANVAKSAGAAVVAFASVSTVINQLTQSFQFADQINDIAKANEVAVSSVLKLSQALSLNGGNAADASKIFSALTASIDQAAQGSEETQKRFASLGITLDELRTLDGQQIFEQTLAGLQAIEDPIKRNAAAMDLLGKAAKGVDIEGLASDYSSNAGNFDDAEESFKAIGEAMDRLDSFTFKTSQTLAETFGPALLSIINVVDNLVFGFDKLEKNISKTANASAKFKSAPRIGDAPVAGAFNLPAEFQAQSPELRQVIDRAAEKAQQEAKRAADKARDAAIEAKRKATEEAKNLDLQESVYRANLEKDYQKQLRDAFDKRKKDEAEAEKEAYELKLKNLDLLQQKANDNFEEAQRQAQQASEQAQREADDLRRSLTDALLRSFERGEGGAKAFFNNLKNIFKARTFQIGIDFVLSKTGLSSIFGSLSSLLSGNAIAGGSGEGFSLGSIKDIGGVIKNGFDGANIAFEQSIQSFGTFITDFGGIGTKIGGAISQYSGFLSSAAPFLQAGLSLLSGDLKGAAFQGAGAAIGSIFGGPIGGAIGSFLGGALGGLFGGGLPPRVTESRSATTSGGITSFYEGADPGKRKLGASSSLDALNQTFANNLNSLFGAFDVNADITSNSLLTKKKNTRSRFWASINGEFLGFDDASFGKKGTMDEAFASLVERALGSYTVTAIKASDLPEGIKKFFDGLVKKEEVAETINTLTSMKKALVDLPPIFNAVRNAIDTTAYTTSLAQLQAQFQATQTFVDLFYSGTEKFDIFTAQLNSQLEALNQTLPSSRDEYRALVESINVVDEATRDQFNGLIALAPAMNEYFNLLSQQADGINEVNQALADGLNQNLFSTFADYASARASVANGITATGFMGDLSVRRAQGDAELANAVKSLVAQQARTDQILAEIADATRRTREINERWNGDGLPGTRVI